MPKNLTFRQKVEKEIKQINIILSIDGGGAELVRAKNNTVKIKMNKKCKNCSGYKLTFRECVVRELKDKIPEVEKVEIVN